jgi:DNA polymerase elongation subunit (family B)
MSTNNGFPKHWIAADWAIIGDTLMVKYMDSNRTIRYARAPFLPYFFIRECDLDMARSLLFETGAIVERGPYVTVDGYPAVKIMCQRPRGGSGGLRELRDKLEALGITTYESDIPYVKRVMIDLGITAEKIERRAYVDIEVDARAGFPEPEEAPTRIIGIALAGSDGTELFISDEDEKKMLLELKENLRRYDVVTGWNWRRFDGPYLANRAKKWGIPWDLFGTHELDAMQNYKKLSIWGNLGSSYTLENVAKTHLGVEHKGARTKIDMEKLWESFVTDKSLLREYNLTDAKLVRELDRILNLLDPYIMLATEYPVPLGETAWMTVNWETILLQELQRQPYRIVLPRKPRKRKQLDNGKGGNGDNGEGEDEEDSGLVGGYTSKPRPGVYGWSMSLDYRSLYPSIMITFRLSPELVFLYEAWLRSGKKLKEWIAEVFRKEVEVESPKPNAVPPDLNFDYRQYLEFVRALVGANIVKGPVFARVLQELMERRQALKREMKQYPQKSLEFMSRNIRQASIKLLLLSSYGVFGNSSTRFFNPTFFNAITLMGQHLIKKTIAEAEKRGYVHIYSDTDSVFLTCKETGLSACLETERLAEELNEECKKYVIENFGVDPSDFCIYLEPKFVYKNLLFTAAKKRYRGEAVWAEGEFMKMTEMVGFEAKRSDAFALLKKVQDDVHKIIFETDPQKLEVELGAYLDQLERDLFSGKYDEMLVQAKHVQKELEDYESEDPHVRVAARLKEMSLLRRGDEVRWVTVSAHNGLVEEPVDPVTGKVPKPEWSGYAYYYNAILRMIERMLGKRIRDPIDVRAGPGKQVKLHAFF